MVADRDSVQKLPHATDPLDTSTAVWRPFDDVPLLEHFILFVWSRKRYQNGFLDPHASYEHDDPHCCAELLRTAQHTSQVGGRTASSSVVLMSLWAAVHHR